VPGAFAAFLFDLDGTLIDSERETGEALARVLARGQGVAIDQADRDYVVGRSWAAIYDNLRARYPQLTWSREELIERTAHLRHEVFEEQGLTVLPGAHDLLHRTRDLPRALVTGSSRLEVLQVLPHLLPPPDTFHVVVAAEDVPRSKPHPDGYLAACAQLAVAPPTCLVVEDSHAGIAAGRAAGCVVVGVRAGNFGGWDQSHAHVVIDTLHDLTPSLVERLARDYG
jgi:HAD superfamily hydrolase (TIGR01509 family)